ncbi:signal peptidase I [Vulcanibacillus modesticaldus]|uniref:Signal peptidase I n=2 Tax=Vulcanibacillus modesticaldus TaxID=337097 RepID=A0A1D2YXX3_9BACI|nr:signal peptidase I [Vulcanibacillus modesticaldus]
MKELLEWGRAILLAIALAYFIRSFLFSPYIVDGRSMVETLHDGERVIVNELSYRLEQPKRGDIIVFQFDENSAYIKRVIGIPGDIVEVKDDNLYINGELVSEPYIEKKKRKLHSRGLILTEDVKPVKVKDGQLFVMGDNRRNSKDSREFGTIDIDQVIGRADLVFWPIDSFRFLNE